jgi:RimJ/RimL family protein N-acetyltransferase
MRPIIPARRSVASTMKALTSARLRLRPWSDADLEPFAELNADPQAMRFMPRPLTAAQSAAFAAWAQAAIEVRGFGPWALERHSDGAFLGCVGLMPVGFSAHFTPATELMWRLLPRHWGRGYATEAARECLRFAFTELSLDEVVAFTVPHNERSRALMARIGMRHDAGGDFDHPRLAADDPLRPHVLYRLPRALWIAAGGAAVGVEA